MDSYFSVHQVLSRVFHIKDAMGVCVTLLTGNAGALLVDTGYGLGDLPGQIARITALPLTVINTHAHHDHSAGNRQFDCVYMAKEDVELYNSRFNTAVMRKRILEQASRRGCLPAALDEVAYLVEAGGECRAIDQRSFDLGGVRANVIAAPGHTPGSVVLLVEPYGLLLTGDNWNPTTWLFFPESVSLPDYAKMMNALMELPFEHVLASHSEIMYPRERLARYVNGLTRDTFVCATPSKAGDYYGVRALSCRPDPDTILVFDPAKL